MRFLLDTNVFREINKTRPDVNVAAWLDTVDDADLAISALTVGEIRKGIVKLRARKRDVADQIEARARVTFDTFDERILPVTGEIAELWGELLAQSDKHVYDTGLVATARVHVLTLVTRNLTHVSGRRATTLDPFKPRPKIRPAVTCLRPQGRLSFTTPCGRSRSARRAPG